MSEAEKPNAERLIENDNEFVLIKDGPREFVLTRKELRTFALRVSRILATASPVAIPPHIDVTAASRNYESQPIAPVRCLRKDLVG